MRNRSILILAAIAACSAPASAGQPETTPSTDLKWQQMFPGVAFAPAYGDWTKGAHGKFVRIEKGAHVDLHLHSNDYHAVFLAGRMTNILDGNQRIEVGPGDYFYMAARRPHSHECQSDGGCLFYTYGNSLWDVHLSGDGSN